MTDTTPETTSETAIIEASPTSRLLTQAGLVHEYLGLDASGVQMIKVDRENLIAVSQALVAAGFNYLQCQGGYDLGPGQELVSFYHLVKLTDDAVQPEELRLKVFLPRDDARLPSVYWIWKTADWQERETYDMYGIIYEGHPHLKRLLMPEDWVGYPMRKDYITPDFYELQEAY